MSFSRMSSGLGLGALLLVLPIMAGCDTTSPDPVYADTGVQVSTFTPSANQFTVNSAADIATYERQTSQLSNSVVDGGVVLLYARGDLIFIGGGAEGTWTALPYTQGIEAVGSDGVPYVDYTITYSYSYGVNRLYLDVISSAAGLVEDYIPANIPFRLVTIPPGAPLIQGIDLSNYDEVEAAYGLGR